MWELGRKKWFTKSAPRVQAKMKTLVRKYPKHIKSDIKWLDAYENLIKIEDVEELVRYPNERLYYTLLYDGKDETGCKCRLHTWICS